MNYNTETHVNNRGETLLLTLPDFSTFNPNGALRELEALFAEGRKQADEDAKREMHTFDSLIGTSERFSERLARVYGPLSHLNAAMQTEEIKKVHDKVVELLTAYSSDVLMHKGLYHAYKKYQSGTEYVTLGEEEKKIVDDAILDFELAGVGLLAQKKRTLKSLNAKSARLGTRFSDNIKYATKSWKKYITDTALLSGIPNTILGAMKESAVRSRRRGYKVSLQSTIATGIILYADNRELRREVFVANAAKASDVGPRAKQLDNRPVLEKILRIEHERARLLGATDYVELSLRKKMADSPAQVRAFLRELSAKAHVRAHKEYAELEEFAKTQLDLSELMPWDVGYAMEKLRKEKCGFSEEELRPYFTATKVFEGMFSLAERLYGLSIKEDVGDAKPSVWDPSVRFFRVYDKSGDLRAAFYADLYERKDEKVRKNPGAWADGCMNRLKLSSGVQIPVAYLNCNFTPPSDGKEGQLLHGEVETVFHEFGHDLHHMLGLANYASSNWMRVEWDAIELPSQYMENWCWNKEMLRALSSHVDTGLPIPDELCDRLITSKHFFAAFGTVRQVEMSLIDLELYSGASRDVATVVSDVRKEVRVTPVYEYDRFPNTFSHIFAGGYAAGYFSYKWAEVLSADAFEAYVETGNIFNSTVGSRFLSEILEASGKRGMKESYIAFRGRMPSVDALLRQSGLLPM